MDLVGTAIPAVGHKRAAEGKYTIPLFLLFAGGNMAVESDVKAFSKDLVRWGLVATRRVRKAALSRKTRLGHSWVN